MREIKYQAWQQYEMRMFEVLGLGWDANISHKFDHMTLVSLDDTRTTRYVAGAACSNYLLREFTGLKDKDDKEIYEGDIVHSDWWNCDWEVRWCDGKREFLRSQVGWILDDEKLCSVGHVQELTAHCEISEPPGREDYFNGHVIGNIYENPDLLEKQP